MESNGRLGESDMRVAYKIARIHAKSYRSSVCAAHA